MLVVHGACTDVSQFRLHANDSVQKVVKYLEEQHERMSSQQFSKLDTQPGSNWKPSGLLKNPGCMVGSFLSVSCSIGSTSFWCMGLRIVSLRFFLELWCRLGSVVAWKLFWLLLSGPSNFRFRRLTRSLAREIAALSP